jgi:nucleotide-binding universal stress UspA family protein
MKITAIVVPVAHGEADPVIDAAIELARAFGASITLLHVDEVPHRMVAIVPGASVEGDVAAARQAASDELDALVGGVRAGGFDRIAGAVVSAPTIADGIVTWSIAHGVDLIVMGTHGRTGIARLVIGSYAEDVIRVAPCPVMTLHLP